MGSRALVFLILTLLAAVLPAACGADTSNTGSGAPSRAASGEGDTGRSGAGASASVDPAARCYVEAVNAENLDALVDCFAPNGVVNDVSREISGRRAIREWARDEVIGGSLRIIGAEPRPDGTRLLVHWAPEGSSGWRAYYTFESEDGLIVRADLQYA